MSFLWFLLKEVGIWREIVVLLIDYVVGYAVGKRGSVYGFGCSILIVSIMKCIREMNDRLSCKRCTISGLKLDLISLVEVEFYY